jgi:hypothetical protein
MGCRSVADDEGAKAAAIFFHGQLARRRTKRCGVRQCDAREVRMVATPFIGSTRWGGGRRRWKVHPTVSKMKRGVGGVPT